MRLRPPRDLGAKKNDAAPAERRVDDRRSLVQILLPPRPSAAKRPRVVDPGDGFDAALTGVRQQAECRTVIKEDVGSRPKAIRQRTVRVDARLNQGTWHIELLRRQRHF